MTERVEKKPNISQKELKLRARAKNKKPAFVRAESWKYDRFSLSWRKPKGLDNKIRRKIKGWPPGASVGYKGPKIARYLHPSGYREVIVNNVAELSKIDPNTEAARLAHTVGKRKRALIIAEAKKLNIKLLNFKVSPEAEKKEEETEAAEGEEQTEEQKTENEKEEDLEEIFKEGKPVETEEPEAAEEEQPTEEKKEAPKKKTKSKPKNEPDEEEGEEEQ
jgi:large subunit ribosomal protein L32e